MSLYAIENELLELFAHIEENDGEITEEFWEQLNITKENLYDKLTNYVKAVKSWTGDTVIIKDEVKKLQANSKVKENRVERLKKAMLNAVELFGVAGKTNKSIDLVTFKLFTKGSSSVDVDTNRIDRLIAEFERFVRELVDAGVLYTGSDVELQGILDSINANLEAEHKAWSDEITEEQDAVNHFLGEFVPYTLADLTTIKITVSTTKSIYDLFRTGKEALVMYGKDPINSSIKDNTSKDDWKFAIANADIMNDSDPVVKYSYPTVAKIVKNTSLVIK